MRILHVTPYYEEAWAYGGIPRAAAATVRGLARRGHRVTVCTTDASLPDARLTGWARPAEPGAPVDVRVFPNLSNAAAYRLQFFTPLGLGRFVRGHAPGFDVAHLHGCHHIPGAVASRWLRRHGVPYVVTTHGTAPYLERRRIAKRLFDATIDRRTLAGASRVIAVSDAERRQLVEHGVSPDAISVVPNPLDLADAAPRSGEFRRRLGIRDDAPVVLFLGRFSRDKRLDVLVEAFAGLARPDAQLVLAGNDMGAGAEIAALVDRFRIRPRTHLPGLLTGGGRFAALADASVVAYASEHEVFGLVPVEALACGTPVVVSNDSGCGDIVGAAGGGIAVPPGQPAALRDALAAILGDQAGWRTRAAAAGDHVRRRYDSEIICGALEAVYASARRGRTVVEQAG